MPQALRDHLETLDERNLLLRVPKEVGRDEMGALINQSDRTILFERIKECPDFRVVDLLFKDRAHQARVLGVEPKAFVSTLGDLLRRGPGEMRTVEEAPCQEVVLTGKEVDLTALPIARHSDLDPGPYITGGFDIIRDPDYGTTNSCYPRMLIADRDEGILSFVTPHSWAIIQKFQERGMKEMPHATVIGPHPLFEVAANLSTYHAPYFGEIEYAGRFMGRPAEMVKCKTVDLEVPAHAEVIIEGTLQLDRDTFKSEGPSVSPSGYAVPREPSMMPVLKVSAITMRKDPIFRHAQSTCLPSQSSDHVVLPRLCHEAMLFNRLKDMGTEVLDVSFPLFGAALTVILQFRHIAIEGQSKDGLLCAMGAPWLNSKIAIAVDEDIDIYDPADVFHAVATRVNPETDIISIAGTRANFMEPSGAPIPGRAPYRTIGKIGIDATKPPLYRENDRKDFERITPVGWGEVRLESFLGD